MKNCSEYLPSISNQNNCINSGRNYKKNIQSNGTLTQPLQNNLLNKRTNKDCNNLLFLNEGRSRGVRLEDVLWWICFLFTVWCFDIPATLIFSRKINRFYLQIMAFCLLLVVFFTFLFTFLKNYKTFTYHWIYLSIQYLTILFLTAVPLSFCFAIWEEFKIWSIYITYVGIQSTLATIAVF